ncbi:MAG: MBL fold metallo-hydrolase [Deltaproteobacteria bacterium]|jgi:phosphoribosyl 1,2-cyclic phosphodiesterase|nr:MBL fold metallo-hydrolase [Deltaproteobacteria bacterium]
MKITMRGVRGGIASPTPDTAIYGGNTACVEVRTANGILLFLDAGTGLREAGEQLPASGEAHVCVTHAHMDHFLGLWFFKPVHSPDWTTHLYLPDWLADLPERFFQCGLFPVPLDQLAGKIIRHPVSAGEAFHLMPQSGPQIWDEESGARVEVFATQHPGGALGYRVQADKAAFVYTGDHEITPDPEALARAAAMLRDTDLAVVDAQYSRKDYQPGYGHSAWEDWLDAAELAGARRLLFSHHDPARSDAELAALDTLLQGAEGNAAWARAAKDRQCFTLADGVIGECNFTR